MEILGQPVLPWLNPECVEIHTFGSRLTHVEFCICSDEEMKAELALWRNVLAGTKAKVLTYAASLFLQDLPEVSGKPDSLPHPSQAQRNCGLLQPLLHYHIKESSMGQFSRAGKKDFTVTLRAHALFFFIICWNSRSQLAAP